MKDASPSTPTNDRSRYVIDSVDAAFRVLRHVAENPDRTLAQLHAALDLNKSRTLRLLVTLEAHNMVQSDDAGRWGLGMGALLVGNAASEQLNIATVIQPHLDKLRDLTGETAQFRMLSGLSSYCMAIAETAHDVRVHTEIGRPRQLYIGSSKVILAFASDDLVRQVLEKPLESFTQSTVTAADLRAQLAETRARGYSISRGERLVGALALGAPVFNADRTVIGCISLLGPEVRVHPNLECNAAALTAAARDVSTVMGNRVQNSVSVTF